MSIKQNVADKIDQMVRILYRKNTEKQGSLVSQHVILNALLIGIVTTGFLMGWSKFYDSRNRASVKVELSRWQVLMGKSDEVCWENKNSSECPAMKDNAELWNSSLKRRSPEYLEQIEDDLKKPFWLGLKISTAELKRASSAGANRLMLGLLFSQYEIWVDGERVQIGDFHENDLPVAIDLTHTRLQQDEPLYIAVAVTRDGSMRTIDSDWFVPEMGFYTSASSEKQIRWTAFIHDTHFYALFAVFLLFGMIFRHASRTKEDKVEYPAVAALSLILAGMQFILADSTFRLLGPALYYSILNGLLVAEIFAVIGFGLAFSRSRHEILSLIFAAVPLSFITFAVISAVRDDGGRMTEILLTFFSPLAYIITGILCFLQFLYLRINRDKIPSSPQRRLLLAIMSLIFCFIGFGFFIESMHALAVEVHWVRALLIVPLFVLATVVASSARSNYRIIETTSISSFHRLTPLPDAVHGIVINLDIRSSEKLFRTGAREDVGGTIMSTVISQIWNRFAASGATILQSSGDDLLVLYPDTRLQSDPTIWFTTLREVHEELQLIAQQLADTQPELATLKSLDFRAAIGAGSVRPLWRVIGRTKVPTWIEAGNKNLFVDTARLIELLRQQNESQHIGSFVIVDETLSSQLKEQNISIVKAVTGEGKHGRMYSGTVVKIEGA